MRKKRTSRAVDEEDEGDDEGSREDVGDGEEPWMLKRRKRGMKRVRRRERMRRSREDQMCNRGSAQRYRPARSPLLKMRKWAAVKRRGFNDGFTGWIDAVIGGKTAWRLSFVEE